MDATNFAAPCVQTPAFGKTIPGESEDCLYLNVWAPAVNNDVSTLSVLKRELLPVMVWIYGGCFDDGATSNPLYDGGRVVAASGGEVIVVSVAYRLGPFGFLGSKDLLEESPGNGTGNFGLQDQSAALAWVRANIETFGGDPSRVTIWGESAGAASVACHSVMKPSWKLFESAILESGSFAAWTASPLSVAQTQFDAISAATGCSTLSCLRSLSTDAVAAQWLTGSRGGGAAVCGWNPTIDGKVLRDDPRQLARAGELHPSASVLLGSNKDEGSIFLSEVPLLTRFQFEAWIEVVFGSNHSKEISKHYPVQGDLFWWKAVEIFGDAFFSCPARRTASWFMNANSSRAVYLYYFTHTIADTRINPLLGAYHGVEIPFVFDSVAGTYQLDSPYGYFPLPFFPTSGERRLQGAF
jgi:carboxylesterase type B